MKLSTSEHEVEVEKLLWENRTLRIWLQSTHALARDDQGMTIALGLNARETLEYLRLEVWAARGSGTGALLSAEQRERRTALANQLAQALAKDLIENVNFLMGPRIKH